ncbi:hypothetical protein BDV93DRAFT_168388 [Ceratobasidium sp. AG-I]|nr:hypothetical protein BDV93DRAFT_168388 [Ceratobasidium sp. AG-I]
MKSATLIQAGCGVLACLGAEAFALPGGRHNNQVRPRHPTPSTGDVTRTVLVTVSLGPSGVVTIPPSDDSSTTTSTPIVSTLTFVTEVTTTVLPTPIPAPSESVSTSSSSLSTSPFDTSSIPVSTSTVEPTPTSSSVAAPDPTPPLDPNINPITAPAQGGGNPVLAQNAADAQAMNRAFRNLKMSDKCEDGAEGCVGDSPVSCGGGTWLPYFCMVQEARCRAVPRMQTNGVVLGCYNDADVSARFASTGQPGNAFGE